jgi:hypothetical protein
MKFSYVFVAVLWMDTEHANSMGADCEVNTIVKVLAKLRHDLWQMIRLRGSDEIPPRSRRHFQNFIVINIIVWICGFAV